MRALITGLGGFVGRHLARHLSATGDDVWGLVRSEQPPIASLPTVRADIRDVSAVRDAVREVRPQVIYHLAGRTHVGSSWKDRGETLDINLGGAAAVLEAALAIAPHPRVLLVGSAEVYGRSAAEHDQLPEDAALRPITPYGLSKAAQELLGAQYARTTELDVVLVRAFNHTGTGQDSKFVIADWARQVARIERELQEPRVVVGNLDVTKDFSDVRDVVVAYRTLAERGVRGEVYNVCSGNATSLRDVLESFAKLSRVPFDVERDPERLRPVDVARVVGNPARLRDDVGWSPTVAFADTMAAVLDDWRTRVAR